MCYLDHQVQVNQHFLNIIGGIEKADGGSISIDGELMESMNEKKLSLIEESIWDMYFSLTT